MKVAARLTLAQAAMLDASELELLSISDLDVHPHDLKSAAALWCALRGVPEEDEGARAEVLDDAPLVVALSLPAVEFLRWFRRASWDDWTRTEEHGEAWAWGVLDAARAAVSLLGCTAAQLPISAAMVRQDRTP